MEGRNNRGGGRGGGGRGGGGRGGGRGGRGGGDQHQQSHYQHQQYSRGGGRGGEGWVHGGANQSSGQQGSYRPASGQSGAYRPPSGQGVGPARPEFVESSGRGGYGGGGRGGGGAWGGSGVGQARPEFVESSGRGGYGGGGRGGGGAWGGSGVGQARQEIVESSGRGGYGGGGGGAWGGSGVGQARPEIVESSGGGYGGGGRGGGGGVWGGSSRAWVASVPEQSQSQSQKAPESLPDAAIPDIQSLKISEQSPPSSISGSTDKKLVPIKRPDKGGRNAIGTVNLLVNHFPVKFNPETIITHYDVDIQPEVPSKARSGKIPKYKLQMIREKLFSDDPTRFQLSKTAYDGAKNIFSAVPLPTGKFKVDISEGEDVKRSSYIVAINPVNELKFCKLKDYMCGNLASVPRDVLQGMDVVMKENPSMHRISFAGKFFPKEFNKEDDLGGGIAAMRGFQHSLKPTSQGMALCLDYSVLAFRKRLPVIEFLKEHLRGFSLNDFRRRRREVLNVLKGLKVNVTHRVTKQKYLIAGLTDRDTRDLSFDEIDPEGITPPKKTLLVNYFKKKYGKEIIYQDIPCLDLGKNSKKPNHVPMEFCILVEGQRYPKDDLDRNAGMLLKDLSLAKPHIRRNTICEMVRAADGPCGGDVTQNFEIQLVKNMTSVVGRVLGPPEIKVGSGNVRVDRDKCQWNLVGKRVVDGKPIERWALLDFSSADRFRLAPDHFIPNLQNRCRNLGMSMKDPLVYRRTNMNVFLDADELRQLLVGVMKQADEAGKGRLQIIVCVMTKKDPGYKFLKWISETDIGIVTQCCLSTPANKGQDQYLANLALKINAKLGGSNFELLERLPNFGGDGHVMFIGADVNHPGALNSSCPSMAAVVATVNWPAANRYTARVCPQHHRTEKIQNFGNMCVDLVRTYTQINKVKPAKIIVFRDGVSEGQFDMVLNEELLDLLEKLSLAFDKENYRPTITLVVAGKRHQTRLFPESQRDGGITGNVPPGTVVDTKVVHLFDFDFYLNSHFGGLGTSKPTHYSVLWDEHNFTSDKLQKLIYDLCFTFARCTKPVSLVPPVYYADLVAYRGRMFQEVVMELYPGSVASSSSGGSSSSTTNNASFDEKFYKLHPELENIMFWM